MKYIIVGGVAGGASAAARLRRLCEQAEILLLEQGEYISFANCGLPYYVGGEIPDKEDLLVQTPEQFARRTNVQVRTGHRVAAVDTAAKTVQVVQAATGEGYTESYDILLLAPGAAPVVPPWAGGDDARIFTLRTIPDTLVLRGYIEEKRPQTAVVVGGGAIGLEMAENFARQGLAVAVVEKADHLLPNLDSDMAAGVHQHLRQAGVQLYLSAAVAGFECDAPGNPLQVKLEDGQVLPADLVLLSMGVRPDTGFLQGAGIAQNARGAIVVDDHLRTSAPDVYAVGDAVELRHFVSGQRVSLPLAGPANKQGRIAADNMAGGDSVYQGTQGSAIVRVFGWTVASTGLSEAGANSAGILYDKVYLRGMSHADYYPGAEGMRLKLLFEKETGRVLGAQLVGRDGVDKRCDVLATAIRAGMNVQDLTELELCYAPPYGTAKDVVNMAGYAAENVRNGTVKQYYWEDLEKLPRDGSITLLDVRRPGEYDRGHLEGVVNIPLEKLRERYQELDAAKPVYITCQSGQRSYVACRILQQHGFDCYNFAGGFGLYEELMRGGTLRG